MDTIECIKTRMSIRKFMPDPVPKDKLLDIINTATYSPSYKNTQPWEVILLSGDKKQALSKMLVELLEKGTKPCPDIPEPQSWPETEQARINDLMQKRADATGIDFSDPAVLKRAKEVNFKFYGAPHAIYLFQDKSLTPWSIFDIGLFAQTLMLAAHASGLGTVPQAFATDYAQDIKKFLDIPDTKRLVLGISIGFPDKEAAEKALRTDRDSIDNIVTWIE
jgi:nitroreductase